MFNILLELKRPEAKLQIITLSPRIRKHILQRIFVWHDMESILQVLTVVGQRDSILQKSGSMP